MCYLLKFCLFICPRELIITFWNNFMTTALKFLWESSTSDLFRHWYQLIVFSCLGWDFPNSWSYLIFLILAGSHSGLEYRFWSTFEDCNSNGNWVFWALAMLFCSLFFWLLGALARSLLVLPSVWGNRFWWFSATGWGNQKTLGLIYLLWLGRELGMPDLGCLLGGVSGDAGSAGATRCGMWDDSPCSGSLLLMLWEDSSGSFPGALVPVL